jgi:ubiquitin-protein ligase
MEDQYKKNSNNKTIKPTKINKRLLKDVADVLKNSLVSNGIYYSHDEANAYKGYAMIMGPDNCMYRHGYYFFNFQFPNDYPYSPPKVEYLTNDGNTRFNPNLYRNGKVCISILNTWKGEQWTACQTIRSVLLSLISLFHNKPLLNEPGITESNKYFKKYNNIIEYKNFKVAILKVVKQELLPTQFVPFWVFIRNNFLKNKEDIFNNLNRLIKIHKTAHDEICGIYSMECNINYKKLLEEFNIMFAILDKKETINGKSK